MHQFFVSDPLNLNTLVSFDKETAHQITKVLKLHAQEEFWLCNNKVMALAVLESASSQPVAKVIKYLEVEPLKRDVTLIQAFIRKEKFELVLQKATELGVSRIVPLILERNVVKWEGESNKLSRYRSILKEASEQCHRLTIPTLCDPITLKEIDAYKGKLNFVAYEANDPNHTLKLQLKDEKTISIVIGPEGGISPREIEILNKAGFEAVSLGKRIYRAETAAMVAIHTVDCVLGL